MGRGCPNIEEQAPAWAKEVQVQQDEQGGKATAAIGRMLVLKRSVAHLSHLLTKHKPGSNATWHEEARRVCLLYTSDAADDM
eukprot:3586375-Alexandrium_andersonii.AAC.1